MILSIELIKMITIVDVFDVKENLYLNSKCNDTNYLLSHFSINS
jgi:hypothetical protein